MLLTFYPLLRKLINEKHLYQLLANEKGIAHWKVSMGYGLLQLLVGVCVLVVKPIGVLGVLVLLALLFGGFVWIGAVVRRSLPKNLSQSAQRHGGQGIKRGTDTRCQRS